MPLKVQVTALAEQIGPQQRMDHAHHFRTFLVDGQRVEVRDLHIGFRANRVCHWPRILGELSGTKHGRILNPLDSGRTHIGRKTGIPKHREAFFQAKLEPVATGHAITGPVVEILVGHDRLDALERHVRRGFLAGQYARGVENVQPLVLHGAHVEVIHCDDHENIQIVLAAIHLLVPAHGAFQGVHGVVALLGVAGLNVHAQINVTT